MISCSLTIFDDIEDIAEDVVDATGSVIGDVVDAASSLFEGPGGLVGILLQELHYMLVDLVI